MKKGLLIWVTMLALACVMSFATVLSFADTPDEPVVTDDVVVTEDPVVPDAPDAVDVDQPDVVANAYDFGDSSAWDIECPAVADFNDGNPVEPPVTVTMNGSTVPTSYYVVDYSNNTAVTKNASYTVKRTSDGQEVKTGTFAIVYPMSKYAKVTLSKTALPVKFLKNDASKVITVAQKPTVKVAGYADAALKEGTDYTVAYSNANSKNAGTYVVTVKAKDGSDYTGTLTAKYSITPKALNDSEFSVYAQDKYYTGKKIKPKKINVDYYEEKTGVFMDLVKGAHYTVVKGPTFSKNKKIGFATIKVTLKGKGNFTGTKVLTGSFFIGPEKAKIKSVKAGKKKLTVKWKKSKHADGYIINIYGWNDNGKNTGDKIITVKSKNTLSKTIKNLKSGYHYDVWVQAYKKVYGSKFYVWNNSMKSVKVK